MTAAALLALLLAADPRARLSELEARKAAERQAARELADRERSVLDTLEDVERDLVKQALERTQGNQTHATRLLNISRDALRYKMKKFGFL